MVKHPRKPLTHVVGFDDAPFPPGHRGDVLVVGAVFCASRLEAVLSTRVRRDGANATARLGDTLSASRFRTHLQAILLQGITLAGFNVVDLADLYRRTGIPVMVVSRRAPDLTRIRRALLEKVRGGRRKWRLIESAGPMQAANGVYVQSVGMDAAMRLGVLRQFAVNSAIPEPLRTAHLIAAGVALGESRHRV